MSPIRSGEAPAWLTRRPIAHRGLHDRAAGRIENSLSAARAAMERSYAIECDVQRSADGEALVFHDERLGRLTGRPGAVADLDHRQTRELVLIGSSDRVPSLPEFFDVVGGAVPIVCEIKSAFDGDMRLTDRVRDLAESYAGPLAIKSFDPDVIRHLRLNGAGLPLGIVSEARFGDPEWAALSVERRFAMENMLHIAETRPDFLSFHVGDLPNAVACLWRDGIGLPLVVWTVRTAAQRQMAARWADQIVFEGFTP